MERTIGKPHKEHHLSKLSLIIIILAISILSCAFWSLYAFENPRLPTDFVLWTKVCKIPKVYPFSEEVMSHYIPLAPAKCNYEAPFITKIFDQHTKRYRLHTNMELKQNYVKETESIDCCYRQIERSGAAAIADFTYRLKSCINFQQDFEVPRNIDALIIECRITNTNHIVYNDSHFFIQEKDHVQERFQRNFPIDDKFGILLLGIDSLSQFNFRRTMPRTFVHLQKNNWFELSGYNKVDYNTFPNLMSVLVGVNRHYIEKHCNPDLVGGLDKCNFLWNLFNENGYATAYAEDYTQISTFTYWKLGFLKQPTDYYLRPFQIAIENYLPKKLLAENMYCLGCKHSAEYIYDAAIEFAERFLHQRFFGLFWTNTFSHQYIHYPSAMDERMLDYIKELETRGILNNSIVILLSDHGAHYGNMEHLSSNFLEDRLPMLFIWLPEKFRAKYLNYTYALQINKNRLTSPYDLYMTLKHFMALSTGSKDYLVPPKSCPNCQSLLLPISDQRHCDEAGILDGYCACAFLPSSYDVLESAMHLVDDINEFVRENGFADVCATLEVKRVLHLRRHFKRHFKYVKDFAVHFQIAPNDVEFNAMFSYHRDVNKVSFDIHSVERLNNTEADMKCLNNSDVVKKFCVCKLNVWSK